jgi:DNA polymerase-1
LGYKLILQIHDEVIIEGPAELAKEAHDELVHIMNYPLHERPHTVDFVVDAHIVNSWGEAK